MRHVWLKRFMIMIEDGKLSYEDIAMYTELTLEEVEKIALEKKSA